MFGDPNSVMEKWSKYYPGKRVLNSIRENGYLTVSKQKGPV